MKHLRVTIAVDGDAAPAFFTALGDAPGISETRVLEWNTAPATGETALLAIRGNAEPFAAAAPGMAGVSSVDLSGVDERWTYALVEMDLGAMALFEAIDRARARPGLVVRTPVVYRDGEVLVRTVGDAAALQAGLERVPAGMDVRVDQVGAVYGEPDRPDARLSERQRAAIAAARAVGYYEHPSEATLDDVGAELGCASVTAGEHLRKAEAKLVDAVLDDFGPWL